MSASLITSLDGQYFDANGEPLALGTLTFYAAGTTSLKTIYSSYDAGATLTNPVALDSAGRAQVWGIGLYKVVAKNEAGSVQWTRDYVFANGAEASIIGNFTVNHTTAVTQPYPVTITHSNVYTNSDTYGSGTVLIEASAQNCNQPLLITKKMVDSSSFGNSANLILWNTGGSTTTSASTFATDLEFVCNNPHVNTYNGKFEIGVLSGTSSLSRTGGGTFYIASRRGPQHPSGENTGFERFVNFYALTRGGEIESLGNGLEITPVYDFGSGEYSHITMSNAFQDSIIRNEATLTGKYARIENSGMSDSYIRSASTEGQAAIYVQSGDKDARLELRSNWTTAGTDSAYINLYTENDGTGWRINANGGNGALNIRHYDAGVLAENVDISSTNDGLVSVYRQSDYSKGRIKLSNSSGAAGGGLIDFDSNTGVLDIDATRITRDGTKVSTNGLSLVSTTSGGNSTIDPGEHTDFTFICNTGSLMAAYTFTLPATPSNGQIIRIANRAGITAPVFTSGSATIYNAPSTLAAGTPVAWIYVSSADVWYRIV